MVDQSTNTEPVVGVECGCQTESMEEPSAQPSASEARAVETESDKSEVVTTPVASLSEQHSINMVVLENMELRTKLEIASSQPSAEKKCSKCGEVKALSEYHVDNRKRSGIKSKCKSCSINPTRAPVSDSKRREFVNRELIKKGERMCWTCNTQKLVSDFHPTGSRCKACANEYERKVRASKPKSKRAVFTAENKKLRLGGRMHCVECDEMRDDHPSYKGNVCYVCSRSNAAKNYKSKPVV